MKSNTERIIGKTITSVVVSRNDQWPQNRVFLVFSDDTYFEFYGQGFTCRDGLGIGGVRSAIDHAENMKSLEIKVYPEGAEG